MILDKDLINKLHNKGLEIVVCYHPSFSDPKKDKGEFEPCGNNSGKIRLFIARIDTEYLFNKTLIHELLHAKDLMIMGHSFEFTKKPTRENEVDVLAEYIGKNQPGLVKYVMQLYGLEYPKKLLKKPAHSVR